MPLPINIDALLHGKAVEWERLEFKEGWNPVRTLHTLCAFANDFHNLGGGYIVLGVAERDGQPVLPPAGLDAGQIDRIQKEIVNLGNNAIVPPYHPLVVPYQIGDRHILVLWATGGQTRPYKARVSLGKTDREFAYFIRKGSSTVRARGADETELMSLAATVPFDDRMNQQAKVDDLSRDLMRDYLVAVGSELADAAATAPLVELGRQMNVVAGPDEFTLPLNVGLLFFNPEPHRFFPVTQIDVVWFPEGAGGDRLTEKVFRGPLDRIIRETLDYIRRNYISETIIKHPDRAEANHVENFPYAAIEECVVNAIYHRGYDVREPVEVRIDRDELVVLSYPGPDRSVRLDELRAGRARPRRYRNRRIGEFLKELEFTEGRSTGIPKILRAMKDNGSPPPVFDFDEDHSYFMVRLPVHPAAATGEDHAGAGGVTWREARQVEDHEKDHDEDHDQVHDEDHLVLTETEGRILEACNEEPRSAPELTGFLGYSNRTGNFLRAMDRILADGFVERTIPDRPRSKHQRYRLTPKGRAWLAAHAATKE